MGERMEELTGKQLGPYQVVEPLGEGGMAAVYKAYQPSMERYVALKILPGRLTNKLEFMGRFEQEAKILAQLQHPHILPVFDYGQADDHPYIAMPFLQSGDLTDVMMGRPLPLDQLRRIISQVGDALDYAHQRGLVHRDVKPSNVLLDERGNCLLTDFGIAKIIEGEVPVNFTIEGAFIGTPAYMSPEQGAGQKLDGRSDIYALGIMLYELATGRVPYRAETPLAVVMKHMSDPLPLPRKLNPALPEAVERVILKALAKQPEDRYATAGHMVQALRTAIPEAVVSHFASSDRGATLSSEPGPTVEAHPQETMGTTGARQTSGSRLVWILAAAGVAIVVIGAIAFFAFGRRGEVNSGAIVVAPESETTAAEEIDTLYDDFDDSDFDGDWNAELWTPAHDYEGTVVEQRDGMLSISRQVPGSSGLTAIELSALKIVAIEAVEAGIRLDRDFEASYGDVSLSIGGLVADEWWWFGCNIAAEQGDTEAWAGCDSSEDYAEGITVQFNTWHTLRFEIDPDTMTITFLVDGQKIDEFMPADPVAIKQAEFAVDLRAYSEDGGLITGYFDDVYIELDE
jgi:serine/threonine protein kinase